MSLYNHVSGFDICAPLILTILQRKPSEVPRFRDAWFSADGTKMIVLTRTGGNNRSDYVEQNAAMRKLSGYIEDTDDSFDETFAKFVYLTPGELLDLARQMAKTLKRINAGANTRGPKASIDRVTYAADLITAAPLLEAADEAFRQLRRAVANRAKGKKPMKEMSKPVARRDLPPDSLVIFTEQKGDTYRLILFDVDNEPPRLLSAMDILESRPGFGLEDLCEAFLSHYGNEEAEVISRFWFCVEGGFLQSGELTFTEAAKASHGNPIPRFNNEETKDDQAAGP